MSNGGFDEVCDECGRHVVKAGHDPDCPHAEKADSQQDDGQRTDQATADNDESHPDAVMAVRNARGMISDFEEISLEERHGAIKHAIEELQNARRALPDDY